MKLPVQLLISKNFNLEKTHRDVHVHYMDLDSVTVKSRSMYVIRKKFRR